MQFSNEQAEAIKEFQDWYNNSPEKPFKLAGYAGTGKTTIARHIAGHLNTIFAAMTGKAVTVLQSKGCTNAVTVHGLIYKPLPKGTSEYDELKKMLDADPDNKKLQRKVEEARKSASQPSFTLNENSVLRNYKLLIVDEASMLTKANLDDLMSFKVPTVLLGDPGQLPPVGGRSAFYNYDYVLKEIHRQAKDNPILELAHKIRQNKPIKNGRYGDSIVSAEKPSPELVLSYDQVLVGRNKTRVSINNRFRHLLKYDYVDGSEKNAYPVVGEKVICGRNNYDLGLMNGSLWQVTKSLYVPEEEVVMLDLTDKALPKDQLTPTVSCLAHAHWFRGQEEPAFSFDQAEKFDYAYAITVHKSQGSQWENVVIYDESGMMGKDSAKWMYTALTRASQKVYWKRQ